MITALATIFVFGLIVFIHELGHFITAKLSGMRVDEFAIGFGPILVKKQYGETLYSIRCIPLGGFNKIAGMTKSAAPPDEPLDEGSFYNKPAYKKLIVISAGAIFNFLLAIVIYFGLNATVGTMVSTDKPIIGSVVTGGAADLGKLQGGDIILSIDNQPISKWSEISERLKGTANHGVTVVVERKGETVESTVIPKLEKDTPKLGIYQSYETIPHSIGESFVLAVQKTGYIIGAMVDGLREMVVGKEQAEVSGPVGISHMAGSIAQQGFAPLLSFAALLSINLGVINLLPLPVLDGGHLIIILIEAITRRKLPAKALMYIQMVGIALLVTIFVYATAKDIIQLL